MNCIYCEIGISEKLFSEVAEYSPTDEIICELDNYLNENPILDYITFSGCGEPTLHSGLENIVTFLKNNYPQYKLCLITNGTHLDYKRNALLNLDIVMPSLDCVDENIFKKLNRPSNSLKVEKIVETLIEFRKHFKGQIWLEIFFVKGINNSFEQHRPLTKSEISEILNINFKELNKYLNKMSDKKLVELKKQERGVFVKQKV